MSIDEVKQTIEEIHDNNERIKQILSTEMICLNLLNI